MSTHRNVGDILVGIGRLTQDEVDRALAHQRAHGGFFGEALLALGLVSRQELDWVLASQFDLPYVVPRVDEVDLAAARLVTREWALAHTALPILRTPDALKVVVSAPNREGEALGELQERVGLPVERAVASAEQIRSLVHEVFALPVERRVAVIPRRVGDFLDEAVLADADRFGISAHGLRTTGWYVARGRTWRAAVDVHWRQDLARTLVPANGEALAAGLRQWNADLRVKEAIVPVHVKELVTRDGAELVFEPVPLLDDPLSVPTPPADLLSEIAMIVASGAGKFRVRSSPAAFAADVLPHLPAVLLDRSLRALHLTDRSEARRPPSTVVLPEGPEREAVLEALGGFGFDVLTGELADRAPPLWTRVLGLARTTFLVLPPEVDADESFAAGLRWELTLQHAASTEWTWALEPLRPAR